MTWFRKTVILTHRYLGIALSLLFVVWFASGITMMWAGGMPRLIPDERLERLAPIDLRAVRLTPLEAAQKADVEPGATTLLMVMDRPAYRVGGGFTVFADNGDLLEEVDATQAATIVSGFMKVPDVPGRLSRHDHGTRPVDARPEPPDAAAQVSRSTIPEGHQVYVSAWLAEVTMLTSRRSRTLAWLGTIPHWFYFAALRSNQPLWYQIVVWTSGLGCRAGAPRADSRRHAVQMVAAAAVDRHPLFGLDALALRHGRDLRRVHADVGVQRHAVDGAVRLGDAAGPADSAQRVHRRHRRALAFSGRWIPRSGTR